MKPCNLFMRPIDKILNHYAATSVLLSSSALYSRINFQQNNVSNVLSFSLFYLSPFLCFIFLCVYVFLFSCLIILVSLSTHHCNAVLTFLLRPRNDFYLFTWTDKRKACIWISAPIGHSLSVVMIIIWPVRWKRWSDLYLQSSLSSALENRYREAHLETKIYRYSWWFIDVCTLVGGGYFTLTAKKA